ncbi:hypothetical protein EYF80_046102 [Liparis tanakae]|uniref:Uncharacterized protein n=1 Tax=Liparis tanakae TaxID=230148 RepID=A0A4Z2FRD3_9TELE|nr:hypothetical protein EYF80_046102 [Liparis tanakae]
MGGADGNGSSHLHSFTAKGLLQSQMTVPRRSPLLPIIIIIIIIAGIKASHRYITVFLSVPLHRAEGSGRYISAHDRPFLNQPRLLLFNNITISKRPRDFCASRLVTEILIQQSWSEHLEFGPSLAWRPGDGTTRPGYANASAGLPLLRDARLY